MPSGTPLRVAVRLRPPQPHDAQGGGLGAPAVEPRGAGRLDVLTPEAAAQAFAFDHVFHPDATQHEVYARCALPLVDAVLEARNACIFAFGATGAGKTFSMLGPEGGRRRGAQDGILPRVAAELFRRIAHLEEGARQALGSGGFSAYEVRCSFLEVYRESAFDLLAGPVSASRDPASACALREDRDGRVYAEGAREEVVRSLEQLLAALRRGAEARSTAATGVHAHSSRSHALLVLTVEHRWRDVGAADATKFKSQTARFTLVDLAGAEGMERAHGGAVDAAGVGTNMGLLVLGRVIHALASGERVPYRDSTLTRLMQSSLGGNAVTQMLACISPAAHEVGVTLQTLRYATSARDVRQCASVAAVCEEADFDPMAGDVEDDDEDLQRRCIWIETSFGDVFARCCGDPLDPLLLYVHGSGPRNSSMCWNDLVLDVARLARERAGAGMPERFFHVAIDCPGYGRSPGSRQTIRSYPGQLLASVVCSLGRRSAAGLIGSSQGACAIFNCALEEPQLARTLAVCHPVGHAPQRYTAIAQPALLIFDVEDAGHPVSVGRQMRRYLPNPRYFEFARSTDGDWEVLHMGEEVVSMLLDHWECMGKRRAAKGYLDDRLPEMHREAGGLRAWSEPHGGEWLPWGNVGAACEAEPEGAAGDVWSAALDPCSNLLVYTNTRTGFRSKVRPRGARVVVERVGGEAAGAPEGAAEAAAPALFEEGGDEDEEEEEDVRQQRLAREAGEAAEREASQIDCDLCLKPLLDPLRLLRCRCALCACCVERTVRYTRRCPACGGAAATAGRGVAAAADDAAAELARRMEERKLSPELAEQREFLSQLQLLRTRVTRLVLEYGNTSAAQGSKTAYTTFVRAVLVEGSACDKSKAITKVEFNINPGYSKPTETAKEPKSKSLGFAFEYAMARPYPCFMTVHFVAALGLPKLQIEFEVQEEAKVARRIVLQTPSGDGAGGWRPSDSVTFDAVPPRSGWIRYSAARSAGAEYLPEEDAVAHFAGPGQAFAHAPAGPGSAPAAARAPGRARSTSRASSRSSSSRASSRGPSRAR